MELAQNIQAVRAKIAQAAADAGRTPGEITLCAATKVQTDETIRAAIAAGVQVCGENRVQELTAHLEAGAYEGARVHFIGHLQTNKVKQVVGKVELIHSVDSERLLRAIHSQAEKLGIVQDILLEVNIAGEESKGGCSPQEAEELARSNRRSLRTPPPSPRDLLLSGWAPPCLGPGLPWARPGRTYTNDALKKRGTCDGTF